MKPVLIADDKTFPPNPPTDLNDAAVIADNDWAAFSRITHMRNHWDRPNWFPCRRAYYWMLEFPEHPALIDLARRCKHAVAPLGMDAIPEDGLHITMPRIGEIDVPRTQLNELANAAAEHVPAAFALRVGSLSGSYGALRFTVAPWEPLVGLHAALSATNRRFGLGNGAPSSRYRPHLGIAYNSAPRPAQPVIDLVATLRSETTVVVDVASVELVELRRESAAYKWDVLRSVRLPAAG
jgi:2'-5' RNA ligase